MFSKLILAITAVVIALIGSQSFASEAKGIVRIVGQPGDGQPASAFLEKCGVDEHGNLKKFTCGVGSIPETLFEPKLNEDMELPVGRYLVFYDLVGSGIFIDITAGNTTTVKLERVDFPEGVNPGDVRVIADLTDSKARARSLLTDFAVDTFEQYLFERNGGNVPNTPENERFYSGMEKATSPDDLLNLLVKIDDKGFPYYWEVFHSEFIGTNGVPAPCIWAGDTGHFVTVLPGNVYSFLIYTQETPTIIHGVHSKEL